MNLLNRTLVSCAMSLRRLKRIFLFVVIIFTVFGIWKTFLLKSKENYSNNDELGDFLDKDEDEISTSLPNISASLQRFLPLSYDSEYFMVPRADLDGFGDITWYDTMNNISDIMSKCNDRELCKAFSYSDEKKKPRTGFLKQSFRIPDSSSLNLYIKKEFIHSYKKVLSVSLECPVINVTTDRENCKLPVLDPHSKDIAHMISTLAPMKCDDRELYTALDNNILRLREDKRNDTNILHVVAEPIRRPNGEVRSDYKSNLGKPRYLTINKTSFKLEEDLWKVTTKLKKGSKLTTYHMSVVEKQEVLSRMLPTDAPLDIILIQMDGTSEAHFRRMLPMTHAFLKDELGSYMFKGYSVVGDATLPNANAMLTGNTVEENKEQHKKDKNLDNWPLLFKDLKKNGFATMWSEDFAFLGLYTLTLPGFKYPPTDHYARPLWHNSGAGMCLGGQFQVKLQFDYLKSFMTSYPRRRKFGYTFLCDLCHRDLNLLSIADLEMVTFFKTLKKENRFNESMFIMMSDHGARFGGIRNTHQGKLEERLPFLSITLPSWFKKKFPERVANLQRNTEIITSPFDLYATFLHLLSFSKPSVKTKRGTSLFEALPKKRTCKDTGITDQWCPCLEWHPVDPAHPHIIGSARHVVLMMNQNLAKYELSNRLCKRVKLKRIINAVHKVPIKDIGSKNVDRCSYQIQIETAPAKARFEVIVEVMNTGVYNVIGEVSRINAYGSTAECIESKVPAVRKYCYCK